MLDYNHDPIADAFDEFRAAEAFSSQDAAGPAAVRATVARRHRIKVTTFSVLGALLVAVPIAAFAAHPRGNNPPPDVTDSATPSPTSSPSPSPSLSPSAPPSRDAKFTGAQLIAAKARVTEQREWSCDDRLGPEPPQGIEAVRMVVRKVVYTNLDNDSSLETAALVVCSVGDSNNSQVAAYDIDAAGAPVLLGAVVNSLHPHDIVDLAAWQGGGVVAVVNFNEELPVPDHPANQNREFYWDGTVFKQIGGPTAFDRKRAELSLGAEPLVLGPVENGRRKGTLKVTVTNHGPDASKELYVAFLISGVTIVDGEGNMYKHNPLGPNVTASFPIKIEVDQTYTKATFGLAVSSLIDDPKMENNYVEVSINRL